MYWRRRLTRLEAAIYASLAAIFLAAMADRLVYVMELAERAAMETTIIRVNAALNTRLAYELVLGKNPDVSAWLRRNPFELADAWPPNFIRGADTSNLGALERGSWSYDQTHAELIYLPRLRFRLSVADPAGALRFRLMRKTADQPYALVATSFFSWD
jgi:hypothetical protein